MVTLFFFEKACRSNKGIIRVNLSTKSNNSKVINLTSIVIIIIMIPDITIGTWHNAYGFLKQFRHQFSNCICMYTDMYSGSYKQVEIIKLIVSVNQKQALLVFTCSLLHIVPIYNQFIQS